MTTAKVWILPQGSKNPIDVDIVEEMSIADVKRAYIKASGDPTPLMNVCLSSNGKELSNMSTYKFYKEDVNFGLADVLHASSAVENNTGAEVATGQEQLLKSKKTLDELEICRTGEQPFFDALLKVYSEAIPQLGNLPDLRAYPKALPSPHTTQFVLRDLPLRVFKTLQAWDESVKKDNYNSEKGRYLAGPNGVGKSVVIYSLVSLARAHNWIVVYVPQCDEWAASTSYNGSIKYLLRCFAVALAGLYSRSVSTPSLNGKTWGELLVSGLGDKNSEQVLQELTDELCDQMDIPVLFVFDEVNGLFTQEVPWGKLAKATKPFRKYAASLNLLTIKRGWKILSGTGHERFLDDLPSGYMTSVMHLAPFEQPDFEVLLQSDVCHPWIRNTPARSLVHSSIATSTGRVPRMLQILSEIIHQKTNPSGSSYSVGLCNTYIDSIHTGKVNPLKKVQHFLDIFSQITEDNFKATHTDYYATLSADDKPTFIRMNIDVMTHAPNVFVTRRYVDKNLIYQDPNSETETRYLPLTPAAGRAILSHLRAHPTLTAVTSHQYVMSAATRPEVGRAFERDFLETVLLRQTVRLHTMKLGCPTASPFLLKCDYSIPLKSPNKDIVSAGRLFENLVVRPYTMLVPEAFDYPIIDYILVGENVVSLFQVTVGKITTKLPITGSVYSAIYDSTRWEMQQNVTAGKKKSFVECLLGSLTGEDAEVLIVADKLQVTKPVGWSLEYIIIAARCAEGGVLPTVEKDLPWVSVLTEQSLVDLFGQPLYDHVRKIGLQKE